jgi:16S rRNA (cytosine1402-N4)-methyltransferase
MGELEHLTSTSKNKHIPVLLKEVIDGLAVGAGGHYLDATIGGGGHSQKILKACEPDGRVLGLDRDPEAVDRVIKRFKQYGSRVTIVHASYGHLMEIASKEGFLPLDGVLYDLGFSSWQIENPDRGFSYQEDGLLDMRYDPSSMSVTAAQLVNNLSEKELAEIIWRYGEENQSRRIADAIARKRPIQSSRQLADIIAKAKVGNSKGRLHPATRTFQALRIAVNDELNILETSLPQAVQVLRIGGRIAVISFHSLEDRIVKQFFKQESRDCICPPKIPVCICNHQRSLKILTKKVIRPTASEITMNPRSRSARLRLAEKVADE